MSTRTLAARYELHHRLGGGGMGAVWEARDLVLQRQVAVKVLAGVGAQDRAFLREARALSRLRHANIVGLYDAGTDEGDAYLVLELVRGHTLGAAIAAGPLDAGEVREVGRALAEALAHAHALGVVHRDLSPGNVLLQDGGRVRLADFGIARLAEATATAHGEVWGTPAYVAPEQVLGGEVGPPADVYALGLVLLEALTGERAFPGTPTEASLARLHRDPVLPAALPADLRELIAAMTAREPAARPTAGAVALRLGAPLPVQRTQPVTTPFAGPRGTMALPPAAVPLLRTAPWWRRRAAAVVGLLLLSVALLGVALRADPVAAPQPVATVEPDTPPSEPSPAPSTHEHDDEADDGDDGGGGRNGKGKGKDKD